MTYETYRYVFLGAGVASVIFLVISIILFFVLNIPKIISDLSGRTERRAVENIRLHNEQTGDKAYKSSQVNLERGKLTDKISKSGRLIPRDETPFVTGAGTEKLMEHHSVASETSLLVDSYSTSVLASGGTETSVLTQGFGETSVLGQGYEKHLGEISALNQEQGETSVLDAMLFDPFGEDGEILPIDRVRMDPTQEFKVEFEITYVHTDEIITQEANW